MDNHTLSLDDLKEKIAIIWPEPSDKMNLVPLAGDASTRRYYRVSEEGFKTLGRHLIVMQLEKPQPNTSIDFIVLTEFLMKLGMPVPKLYYYDEEKGFLYLEDFGDLLLQDIVDSLTNREEKSKWYQKAIKLLAELQIQGGKNSDQSCPAFTRYFDLEKLMWEMDFMIAHFLQNLRDCRLEQEDIEEIRGVLIPLCQKLADQERCFTHRDFHSRNIMALDGSLKIIDFQDARLGPRQYDLVSLLKDSYVELDDALVDEMIDYFIDCLEDAGIKKIDRSAFKQIFDLMSIQRNLKAIGTFAYQKAQKKNDRYLADIPRTLNYVKKALALRPDLVDLKTILVKYIPEIAS
jgi:aminoglycoside/choline kinase family phosphotransferase